MFYLLLILVFFIIGYHIINDVSVRNFPPGPTRYPVIGSWLSLPARGVEKKIPTWRKKFGNIIRYKLLGKNVIFVAGSKEVISGLWNSNFQRRNPTFNPIFGYFLRLITDGLFMGDDEQWREVRKFTLRYLSRIPATTHEFVIHNEMSNLFAKIKSGDIVQINNKFVNFAIKSASAILLGDTTGKYFKEIDSIREDTDKVFRDGRPTGFEIYSLYIRFLLIGTFGRKLVLFGERFFQRVIEDHRASFDENNIRDFVDAYLLQQKVEKESLLTNFYTGFKAQKVGCVLHSSWKMDILPLFIYFFGILEFKVRLAFGCILYPRKYDKELSACLGDLLRISGESIGNTEAFILLYVVLNPDVQKKIHQELDAVLADRLPKLDDRNRLPFIDAVIQETIRINSIAPISVGHLVAETTNFCGYTFPKNSFVQFSLREALMDPEIFEEPHKFKPERFLDARMKSKMIAFGLGKRSCIGKTFAQSSLFLFTVYFFQKYFISLPSGYGNPSTEAEEGFSACPRPFKIVIHERC